MVKLKSGRDLDLEIAKKVIKLQVWFDTERNDWLCCNPKRKDHVVVLPFYSTNSEHAYAIVNTLQNQGFFCHVGSVVRDGKTSWRATFFKKSDKHATAIYGDTLAHAICLAALDLLGYTGTEDPTSNGKVIQFPKKPR